MKGVGKRKAWGEKGKGGKNTALNFLTISYEKPIPKIIESVYHTFSFW
ncbi:hypothetical protein C7475_10948 [Chitinophaga sp. S165]|nr:hypothetical protein C7475_10948 [Chitinophaga sp. S165]